VRSTSARITVAASSWAASGANEPPKAPTGVRSGSQTTTSDPAGALFTMLLNISRPAIGPASGLPD
jgi:hypothetical protein